MSRSNPTLRNPSTRRFEWAGGAGKLQYYNPEDKQTYEVPLPFRFMVLDQLNMVTGYSKSDQSSIWSNEVRNTKEDIMFTKSGKGPLEAAVYNELFQTIKRGGKFTKSVYIAFIDNGNWRIGNFRAVGSSLMPWFDFTKHNSIDEGTVVMTRGEAQTAQTGTFFAPIYTWQKAEPGENEVATALDRQLQIYLSTYLSTPKVDEDGQGIPEPELATPEQKADYESRRAAATVPAPAAQVDDVIINDIGDEPINLDDIPF